MSAKTPSANFIRHLIKVHELFQNDRRLTSQHISLYFALFFEWNENRFRNPFPIFRAEIMNASRIGSANTYIKCLKELDQFGYIQYSPSFNPNKGSHINLYTIDNTGGISSDTAPNTRTDISGVQQVIPFNKQYKRKQTEQTFIKPEQETEKFKIKEKYMPPLIEDVHSYFLTRESTNDQANKFFNYYESNGWLIGGKTKMKNWEAAARNWIINSQSFNVLGTHDKSDRLQTEKDKDYNIPL